MEFITSSISQKGGRKANEDFYGSTVTEKYGCWVAADGLGGHSGGEIASKTVVDSIMEVFAVVEEVNESTLRSCIEYAQDALTEKQKNEPSLSNMRSTVVILATDLKHGLWAHVGDSRLYYFKKGALFFQTKDHSVPQAMVNAGEIGQEKIRYHEDRNRLLRVMGMSEGVRPTVECSMRVLEYGDAFLLCTDGFWEHVVEEEMEADLTGSKSPVEWLGKMEGRLLGRVDGKNDNYTAVAVFVR